MANKNSKYTPAQAKAIKKYLSESVEEIRVRVPKGKKEYYMSIAKASNQSMNAFAIRALDYLIAAENLHPSDNE